MFKKNIEHKFDIVPLVSKRKLSRYKCYEKCAMRVSFVLKLIGVLINYLYYELIKPCIIISMEQ